MVYPWVVDLCIYLGHSPSTYSDFAGYGCTGVELVTFSDYAAAIIALEGLSTRPMVPTEQVGLQRVSRLLHEVGDPHLSFPSIHVTGTAGKGSTTMMAGRILQEAGHYTGVFTGPHLASYTERIVVDGQEISPDEWLAYQQRIWPIVDQMESNSLPEYMLGRPTFMEVVWTMACLFFSDKNVACAVVEVGRGGRLDASTVNKACTGVITNVSLEHPESLGPTVEAIATQKAGIIKPGMIVVSAATPPATAIIARRTRQENGQFWQVRDIHEATAGEQGAVTITYSIDDEVAGEDLTVSIITPERTYAHLHPGLSGRHQAINAACAVAAIDAFAARTGLVVPEQAVRTGLTRTRLPGRLELLPGHPDILLDGAQTVAAVQALACYVADHYAARPRTLLISVAVEKDLAVRVPILAGLALPGPGDNSGGLVVVTESPWIARSGAAPRIAELARQSGARVVIEQDYIRALDIARAGTPEGALLLVAGSLFLVGAIRTHILHSLGESSSLIPLPGQ